MPRPAHAVTAGLVGFASRLRFPVLFFLTAALFLVDLVLLDAIPFADELLLGLGAVLFGSWKQRRREHADGAVETGSAEKRAELESE
jgi:hypothetical protein